MNNTTTETAMEAVVETQNVPKVVGFVDLSKFNKKGGPKVQEPAPKVEEEKKQYNLLNRTFPVDLFSEVAKLVNKANKDLGRKLAITISKTSKVRQIDHKTGKPSYVTDNNRGSIWYDCSHEEMRKHFTNDYNLLLISAEKGIRKCESIDVLEIAENTPFYCVYVDKNGRFDFIKNLCLANNKTEIKYRSFANDIGSKGHYIITLRDVKHGSFATGVEGEICHLFIERK